MTEKNKFERYIDAHSSTIISALIGLIGAAILIVQIHYQNVHNDRQYQIQLDSYNADTERHHDAKIEEEKRWQFDISKFVWDHAEQLSDCDIENNYILNMVSVLPPHGRDIAQRHISQFQSKCPMDPQSKNSKFQEPARTEIVIPAKSFSQSLNVATSSHYGQELIQNAPPYHSRPNAATYEFNATAGFYELWIAYAAKVSRSVRITLNNKLVTSNGLADTTGGWDIVENINQGRVELRSGHNSLTLARGDVFPHIRSIELKPIE